jgi:hypothetical protein
VALLADSRWPLTKLPERCPSGWRIPQSYHGKAAETWLLVNARHLLDIGGPQRVAERGYMRRGVQESRHSTRDAVLVTLASIQQRQAFECCDLAWSNLNTDQHAPMSAPVPVGVAPLPSKLSSLFIRRHVHRVT